jgi:4-amino-4-deoxy-L-arabinose transferase-like glycosyltransferase
MRRRQGARSYAVATPLLVPAAIAALTFGMYLATMAPGLYTIDSPELTTAAYKLGIAHAPGYPFYTLFGWAFSHAVPVGSVAFRMNLLSAVFATAGVVVTYALAMRVTSRPAFAAAAALMLAFSYHFWANALIAEIYALDAALFAGILLAAIEWRRSRTAVAAAAVGVLLGLALATRTTSVLYVPALAAFALMSAPRDARSFAAATAGTLAGLAFYLYLPLRSAAGTDIGPGGYALDGSHTVFDLATWSGFWDHVTAASFRSDAFAYSVSGAFGEAGSFLQWLTWAFVVVGLPLGLMGTVRLWREDRALLALVLGTAVPVTFFFINYGTPDKEFMFVPAYVVWALLVASGLEEALAALPEAWRTSTLLLAAPLLLPLVALGINLPRVSLHGDQSVRTHAESVFAGLEPGAILYGPFMDVAPLQYLQSVEGQRTDVAIVNTWTIDDPDAFLRALAIENVGHRAFYVTRAEHALGGEFQLTKEGEVYRVSARAP